jgi:hypothetical protein
MEEKNIIEQIRKQIDAGFSSKEIIENLKQDGFSKEEINSKLGLIKKANGVAASSGSTVSSGKLIWTIILVVFFVIRLIMRLNK